MNAQTESARSSRGAATGWEQRPDPAAHPTPPPNHPSDAIRAAVAKIGELREFAAYYAAAKADAFKATLRNIAIYVALGLVGAVAGAAVIVTAVVLLLRGVAGAFAALFPRLPWLGDIIVGILFLAIPVVGIMIGMRVLTGTFRRQVVAKYEQRKREQRQRFGGRDVRTEAQSSSSAAA